MRKSILNRLFLVLLSLCVSGVFSVAKSAQPDVRDVPAAERRQALIERHKIMSDLHKKMIACLESGATYETCHSQMVDACQKEFKDHCPGFGPRHMRSNSTDEGRGCFWMKP